jgi:hypothetical protein
MIKIQIRSAAPPFDRPALGVRSARLLGLAEAMGFLSDVPQIARLDFAELEAPLHALLAAGIGRDVIVRFDETQSPEELAESLDRLYDQLEASPNPATEWGALKEVLQPALLQRLLGTSPASFQRYSGGDRETPAVVAGRLHFLARVIAHLAGAYNDYGIRRWFERARPQLAGRAPTELLIGEWDPEGQEAQRVLDLAERINSSPAT